MARLSFGGREISIAAQADLAATHRILVETAKREHAKIMRQDPRPSSFSRFVDGAKGAPEEAVKPNGVIVYEYNRLGEVVQFTLDTLFDRSPVDSGAYRKSHMLFVDGHPVRNLANWREGQEVVILNTVPYARKIEQGRMKMRVSGTSRVYQTAARIVRRRYGNLASIYFTYRSALGLNYVAMPGGDRAGHDRETATRVPAIVLVGLT